MFNASYGKRGWPYNGNFLQNKVCSRARRPSEPDQPAPPGQAGAGAGDETEKGQYYHPPPLPGLSWSWSRRRSEERRGGEEGQY